MMFEGYNKNKDIWVQLEFKSIHQARICNPGLIKIK